MVVWTPDPAELQRGGANVAEEANSLQDAYVKQVEMVMRYLPVSLLSADVGEVTRIVHGALRKPNGVQELKTIFELKNIPMNAWNIAIIKMM